MASPLTITTIPVKIVGVNNKRYQLFLQNTGNQNIYVKKQSLNGAISEPSTTNYDFILYKSGEETSGMTHITIRSIASFRCFVPTGTGTLAYMETNITENC